MIILDHDVLKICTVGWHYNAVDYLRVWMQQRSDWGGTHSWYRTPKDTSYLALTGELWGVLCYNGTVLYYPLLPLGSVCRHPAAASPMKTSVTSLRRVDLNTTNPRVTTSSTPAWSSTIWHQRKQKASYRRRPQLSEKSYKRSGN